MKRGEEGAAGQKWSASFCEEFPKHDGPLKPGDVIEDLLEFEDSSPGQGPRDHALWVVDWMCMIRMEKDCS
ncbi:hypothetical protein HD597_000220 [Nonomuraea thailandensis]|uniref:Uncharacterized protein n=1 Tax=Nonomuraea thailandensis TaxID=1188745 RepID=A0A9X2JYZ3_9ACTN|nr:hypothetical protein [Nonomuraea thailandensis]MCP2353200.1 hypothetical protein [Nonomuraea thailandensis]